MCGVSVPYAFFPMTILMTADTIGGVWTYCIELARALASHDIRVVIATMGAPLSPHQQREADSTHVTIQESHWKLEWMPEPWSDVEAAGAWLLELEHRHAPDVVHLNGFAHGDLGWRAPVLVAGHSCVLSWWRAVKNEDAPGEWNCYREKVASGLHAADLVVAPTQAMLDALQTHYGAFRHARVVFNGRDNDRNSSDSDESSFAPDDQSHDARCAKTNASTTTSSANSPRMSTHAPIEKEAFILAAGRVWDEAKNIEALKRVAPRVSWPVYVAGDEARPDAESMRKEERQEGEQEGENAFDSARGGFQALGKLTPSHLAHWMKRAAIYALPARYEPFGLSALEAALAGCALVLGDIPSLREVWGDAAVFVLPHDDDALQAALQSLIEDEPRRRAMAQAAQQRAQRFTTRAMGASYARIYHELVKNRVA